MYSFIIYCPYFPRYANVWKFSIKNEQNAWNLLLKERLVRLRDGAYSYYHKVLKSTEILGEITNQLVEGAWKKTVFLQVIIKIGLCPVIYLNWILIQMIIYPLHHICNAYRLQLINVCFLVLIFVQKRPRRIPPMIHKRTASSGLFFRPLLLN